MFGMTIAAVAVTAQAANAQVISQYGGSGVYVPGSTYAAPIAQGSLVTSAYYSAPAPAYVAPAYVAPVYAPPVYAARPVVAAPVYVAPSPVVVQMAYSVPAPVYAAPVYAAPVVAAPVAVAPIYGPNVVTQRTRALPNNFTQVTRVYGPTPGPHYSRVRVHNGLFGTTVREVVR
jgi:hypothetical protein